MRRWGDEGDVHALCEGGEMKEMCVHCLYCGEVKEMCVHCVILGR